jgi:hypothetical protein
MGLVSTWVYYEGDENLCPLGGTIGGAAAKSVGETAVPARV